MDVIDKRNNNVYTVFGVAYDNKGYPLFLIYKDNRWVRQSAKYFIPLTKEI